MENDILKTIEEEKQLLQKYRLEMEQFSPYGSQHYETSKKTFEKQMQEIEDLEFELLEKHIEQEQQDQQNLKKQQEHQQKQTQKQNQENNLHKNQFEISNLVDQAEKSLSSISSINTTTDHNINNSNSNNCSKPSSSSSSSLHSDVKSSKSVMSHEDMNPNGLQSNNIYNYENHDAFMHRNMNEYVNDKSLLPNSSHHDNIPPNNNNNNCPVQNINYNVYVIPFMTDVMSGIHNSEDKRISDNSEMSSPTFNQNAIQYRKSFNDKHCNTITLPTSYESKTQKPRINSNEYDGNSPRRPWSLTSPNKLTPNQLNNYSNNNYNHKQTEPMNCLVNNTFDNFNFNFKRNNIQTSSVRSKASTKCNTARPLTKYLPHPSDPTFNLRSYIELSGHNLTALDKYVKINAHSCYGQLNKLSGKHFKIWKKKSFIFDRNRRVFAYYVSSNSRKLKGLMPFDQILEAYSVPSSLSTHNNNNSTQSNSTTTSNYIAPSSTFYRWGVLSQSNSNSNEPQENVFVVRLLDTWNQGRQFKDEIRLCAPTIEVKRLWLDVIFTGAEGYLKTLDATRSRFM